MKSVSIIIPAWNEENTISATLQALFRVDYDKSKCEVIVVAGGSDDTYQVARAFFGATTGFSRYVVILQEPQGKNAAIQKALIQARNEIVVLLDADTIVSKHWLKSMVAPIQEGVCDLTIANPEPIESNYISDYYMLNKTYFLDRISTFSGHSIAFDGAVVKKQIDYFFDKNVKVGVDYLLAKRFIERGHKIRFSKEASVRTHLPSSLKYFVLCELRWLTALINIDGVSFRTLSSSGVVVGALIFLIPLSKTLFIFSLVFNTMYVVKRARIVLVASRSYKTNAQGLLAFVALSYTCHVLCLISYASHFLGLSRRTHLYQGQRYQ